MNQLSSSCKQVGQLLIASLWFKNWYS